MTAGSGTATPAARRVGQGWVHERTPLAEVLAQRGIAPALRASGPGHDMLRWTHRRLPEGELPFLSHPGEETAWLRLELRAQEQRAEALWPESAQIEPLAAGPAKGRTRLAVTLEPRESMFVLVRRDSSPAQPAPLASTSAEPGPGRSELAAEPRMALQGPCSLTFSDGLAALHTLSLPQLQSWHTHEDPWVRDFSGFGRYCTHFELAATALDGGARHWLDLGQVAEVATVELNGVTIGTDWIARYRLEVGQLLRPGRNELEVTVANSWRNRLLADARLPAAQVQSFTVFRAYDLASPLSRPLNSAPETPALPSGLIGPVRLLSSTPLPTP